MFLYLPHKRELLNQRYIPIMEGKHFQKCDVYLDSYMKYSVLAQELITLLETELYY
jgi:hypothetical protein